MFYGCTSLTSLAISNGVTKIRNYAFNGCTKLENISIPLSVDTIEYSAFGNCDNLKNVYYNGHKDQWDKISIDYNEGLEAANIYYNSTVTDIEKVLDSGYCGAETDGKNLMWTFYDDGTLVISGKGEMGKGSWDPFVVKKAVVENGVTRVGGVFEGAFAHCRYMHSVSLPDSVTTIGEDAFYDCWNLTNINIPSNVTSIGDSAFSWCTSLTSVDIPGSVTSIGKYAFCHCEKLANVVIPEGVMKINAYCFTSCSSLESITIPQSVINVDEDAFYGCSALKNVYYSGDEFAWRNISIANKNDSLTSAEIHCAEHVHSYTSEIVAPTCTDQGYTIYTCTVCSESYKDNYIGATGHTEETVAAVAATCTTAGKTEGKVCSVCGEVLVAQEEIPALGHKTEVRGAVEPSCTEAGYTGDEVCSICGETIKEGEVIPATGHHFKGNTCPDCGETRSTADTIRAWFQESFNNMKNFFDKIFGRN